MRKKHRSSPLNIHESFSDIALLMLATFVFLLVTILITSRMAEQIQIPRMKKEMASLQKELIAAKGRNESLLGNLDNVVTMTAESQMEQVLSEVGMNRSNAKRKDFDLFVKGLTDLPGETLHIMVDATGSMHGVTAFIIPVLRIIVIRSGKKLDAITWFSDGKAETYTGSMGNMFDRLMAGAPFIGSEETIGLGFTHAAKSAPKPGAYIIIGDEPSADKIHYFHIPSPVFSIPLGRSNPDTNWAYQKLADETGGKMLQLEFK